MEGIKTHSMTISTHRMSWKLQIGSNIIIYVNEGQYICLYEHTAVSALNIASASESMTNVNVTINKHRMWCIAISGHGIDSTRLDSLGRMEKRKENWNCFVWLLTVKTSSLLSVDILLRCIRSTCPSVLYRVPHIWLLCTAQSILYRQ